MKIPIAKPYFVPEEKQAVIEPLNTGWIVQGLIYTDEHRFSWIRNQCFIGE